MKKFCVPTENLEWKKNRNLHSILLLDMIVNNRLEEPFDKFPKEDEQLPLLSKYLVKSILSEKFYDNFFFTYQKENFKNIEIEKLKDKYSISISNSKNKLIEKKILLKRSNLSLFREILVLGKTLYLGTKEKKQIKSDNLNKSSNLTTVRNFSFRPNEVLKTRSIKISESNFAWDIEKLKRIVNSLQEQIIVNFNLT